MRILVVHSARAEATKVVAQRIADEIAKAGVGADVLAVGQVPDLVPYAAVVVVGSRHWGRWPRDVRRFIRAHGTEMRRLLVWLVSAEPAWPRRKAAEGGVPYRQVCNLLAAVDAEGHARFDPTSKADGDRGLATWSAGVASSVVLHAPVQVSGWVFDGKAQVDELDRSTCMALVATQRGGRLAALHGSQPTAIWVDFRVEDGRLVLTEPAGVDLLTNRIRPVSLAVSATGGSAPWSVVVIGALERLADGRVQLVVARTTGRRRNVPASEGRFMAARGHEQASGSRYERSPSAV